MLIGYARLSTHDQNLGLQIEALTKAGCKKIFSDRLSGSRAERAGLNQAQEALRDGDTLVVWKLDRLGRSVKHLVNLVGELHLQGVQFKSLTDAIDTGTPSGRFFFHVMGQPRRNGTGAHHRTHPCRTRSRPPTRPQRRSHAANNGKQDQIGKETARERTACSRCSNKSRNVRPNSLLVDSSFHTGLECGCQMDGSDALACSFHLTTFTPRMMSQRVSAISASPAGNMM